MKGLRIATESPNPRTRGLDTLPPDVLVSVLIEESSNAVAAVRAAHDELVFAVEYITGALKAGRRLHYVGAGTSGRLAALDAAEMPPTFATLPDLVVAHLAGGDAALRRAVEGAEDDAAAGESAMRASVRAGDVVIGISASGGARYVVRAIEAARSFGARTFAMTAVADCALIRAAEYSILLATGPEPLAGSTRMIAGAAQKIALATLSTAVMVRLGKVYDNLMVDLVATNEKLMRRAQTLVIDLTEVEPTQAKRLLEQANGRVSVAVVMARLGLDARQAQARLEAAAGRLRSVLEGDSPR